MVEIAIAIGVIGFALVAIIGILPTGLEVQRDNRTETIINQDGTFWMEAIRNGTRGAHDLTPFVDRIEITNFLTGANTIYRNLTQSYEVIGLLSRQAMITNEEARVFGWAISGAASEKTAASRELAFKYRMTVHIERATNFAVPFSALSTNTAGVAAYTPLESLFHLRLTFAYPLVADEYKATTRRQSYRMLVSRRVETNGFPYVFFAE